MTAYLLCSTNKVNDNRLVQVAKFNGLETQAYIADAIKKIAGHWHATR